MTNSEELHHRIQESESSPADGEIKIAHTEEDQSFAKSSLGVRTEDEPGISKVLGVPWNVNQDELQFDIRDVVSTMEDSAPTKRGVASATARFFDPVSPVTILFKMFCQQLFKAKIGWD